MCRENPYDSAAKLRHMDERETRADQRLINYVRGVAPFGGGGVPVSARCGPCSCLEPRKCLILPHPVAPKPEPLYRIVYIGGQLGQPRTWPSVLHQVREAHSTRGYGYRPVAVERVPHT